MIIPYQIAILAFVALGVIVVVLIVAATCNTVTKIAQERSLARAIREYGLPADALETLAEIQTLIVAHPDIYQPDEANSALAHWLKLILQMLERKRVDPDLPNKERRYTEIQSELWARAGLDQDKQVGAAMSFLLAYRLPDVVTIETLLTIDRQVYELCRPDSRVNHAQKQKDGE